MIKMSGRATGKNEKFLIGAVAIVALGALCYVFIISPGMDKTKPLKEEIKVLEQKVEAAKNVRVSIENKEKELEKLMVEFDKATESMPKSDRMPEALFELESMADESGLKTVRTELTKAEVFKQKTEGQSTEATQSSEKLKGLMQFNINVSFEGSKDQILTFIDKMENSKRILLVEDVKMTGENKGSVGIVYYSAGKNDGKESYEFN
ncbi:MAG: type 4a pilus biogenesis protein PilO [Clostridium sp.]